MQFQLTDVQKSLRSEVRSFARNEIAPVAAQYDREGTYPEEILNDLGDRGYAGLTLSEEYGGQGAGMVELAILIEELAAEMMPVASALALHLGVATVVERFGSSQLKSEFLPEMARFDTVGALGLSEGDAGSDKHAMETTAERTTAGEDSETLSAEASRDGDEWVLAGHKQWVTNFLDADVVLTYAKTGPDADAPDNISAFLVPAEAFEVDHVWDTLGARSVKTAKVTLSDVRVPDTHRVGEVGRAYRERQQVATGVNVPARAVGLARAAVADAVEYTGEREQFGQAIGDFQGVRWTVADMTARVDAARLLTLRAADRIDRGLDANRERHMAKVYATETAVDVTNDALQLHGGVGYTAAHDVERYLRDARLLTIAGGPNELHRDGLADAVYES